MKRIYHLILAAAVTLTGCAKEIACEDAPGEAAGERGDVTLTIAMPDTGTKTVLGTKDGDNYPVYWQTGDKVAMNGVLSAAVPESDNGSSKTSLYVKDGSLSAPFNILFPGEADVTDKVTFPTTQNYTVNTFAANSLPMYATAANLSDAFTMNYLGAVLRIPVKFNSATTLKQITLSAINGEPIAGTFTVGKSAGALNGGLSSYSTVSTLYYSFGNSGTAFAANATGVFYIGIPKGTYAKGIEMKVYDNEGNFMKAALFTESNTVTAGKVYEFTQRAYNPDGTVFFIESVSDLQTFVNKGGDRYCLLEAQLLNDIDMSGQTYNANEFNFYGTLDGGGHTISGLTKPLFNNLKGSVKNITINSTITDATISSCNDYGVGILCRYAYLSGGEEEETGDYGQVIEGVTTKGSITVSGFSPEHDFSIGGMLGANKGIPMSSCQNQATVTVNGYTPTTSGLQRVGGFCGSVISSDATISGCSNTGAVTITSATPYNGSDIYNVGGLIGTVTKNARIENSTNSGAVTLTEVTGAGDTTPYVMVGGIIGNTRTANITVSGCENLAGATITVGSACVAQNVRVGGVVGSVDNENSTITGCTNRGEIEVQAATLSGTNTFGGVVGVTKAASTVVSNCKNYGAMSNAAGKMDSIGGVIGYFSETGEVIGCENHAAISSTAVPSNDHYFGGIVAKKAAAKTVSFSNLTNEGNISVTCSNHTKNIHMGGIIGGCPGGSSTFSNCNNSGNLTNSSTKSTNDPHHDENGDEVSGSNFTPAVSIGGIIGRVTDNQVSSIAGCTNSGNINNNCAATEIRLGGIVGYTHQTIGSISGCTNSGTISNNVLADFCYIHEGGILGYSNAKVTMSAQNVNTGTIQSNPTSRVNICDLTEGNYDDNVRLAGCIGSYYSNTEAVLTSQKNEGEIVNKGSETCGWVYMGGLQGYAKNVKYTGALNTAYVHNEATVTSRLLIAGILARGDADKVEGSQKQAKVQSSSRNEGNVFNNGTCAEACIGGLCAEVAQSSDLTNSSNAGTIKNTGAVADARLGGVCAYASAYVSLDYSSNEGDVIFEGSATNAVFMAGGIGFQKSNRNAVIRNMTNTGTISCKVDVPSDLEIAGIVADAAGKVTSCTNDGPITIEGNVGAALYAGGVCGWIDTYASNPMQNCTNTVNGTISCGDITIDKQIFCGGVIGGTKKSVAVTFSNLVNRGAITLGDSGISSSISKSTYSYLGGVSGGNNSEIQITYSNCENYGNIFYKGNHTFEVGGITGTATSMPTGAICKADIRYVCTNGGKSNSEVGGIAGWYKTASDGAISGLVYDGTCNTNSSSPRAYTGGIFGAVSDNHSYTFTGCKVGGRVYGIGLDTSSKTEVGLITCAESDNQTINFTDCIIKTGTMRHTKTVTSLVLNHSDCDGDWTKGALCGGKSSVGTMTNCTIGSID